GGGTLKNRAAFPGGVDRVLGAPGSAERRIREAHVTGEIDSLDLVVLSEHAEGHVAAGPQGTPREAGGALGLGRRVGLALGRAARDDDAGIGIRLLPALLPVHDDGARVPDGDHRTLLIVERDVVSGERRRVLPERRAPGEGGDAAVLLERDAGCFAVGGTGRI